MYIYVCTFYPCIDSNCCKTLFKDHAPLSIAKKGYLPSENFLRENEASFEGRLKKHVMRTPVFPSFGA